MADTEWYRRQPFRLGVPNPMTAVYYDNMYYTYISMIFGTHQIPNVIYKVDNTRNARQTHDVRKASIMLW